jgi:hypothetical protein
MRKTIKQLQQEAGETIAFHFLRNSEKIIGDGNVPFPLSKWTRHDGSQWVPESLYSENPNFAVTDKSWPKIHAIAMQRAKNTLLHIGQETYPSCYAHFVKVIKAEAKV